jgi:hypothetical protein
MANKSALDKFLASKINKFHENFVDRYGTDKEQKNFTESLARTDLTEEEEQAGRQALSDALSSVDIGKAANTLLAAFLKKDKLEAMQENLGRMRAIENDLSTLGTPLLKEGADDPDARQIQKLRALKLKKKALLEQYPDESDEIEAIFEARRVKILEGEDR